MSVVKIQRSVLLMLCVKIQEDLTHACARLVLFGRITSVKVIAGSFFLETYLRGCLRYVARLPRNKILKGPSELNA